MQNTGRNYPCSLKELEAMIDEREKRFELITKMSDTNEPTADIVTQMNITDKINELKREIDIFYDYAWLRFGLNLRLIRDENKN